MNDRAEADRRFMDLALRLARRGLGRTWPNPAVGCVVARNDRIIGRGWTQPGGRPHAETEALARAGGAALGATAYVSLEPCAHYGRTPPCTMALIRAGVRRVVVAAPDPDPRVDGKGIAQLRQAGIRVDVGVLRAEAEALNRGFFSRLRRNRPLVTLKLATSLDGRIATASGASRWITGEAARGHGHLLRATHDAILIGSGTALADDPMLDCRLPGLERRSPARVVMDARLRLPPDARLVKTARDHPIWVLTRAGQAGTDALEAAGVVVMPAPVASDGGIDPAGALATLAGRGITRVLIEGGAAIAAAFLAADLVDVIVLYQAPMIIGGDGVPAVGALGLASPAAARRFVGRDARTLGDDIMQVHVRAEETDSPCSPASSPTSAASSASSRRTTGGA